MKELLQGLHHFRSGTFQRERDLFEKLVAGQNPSALFITCSDSRVVPSLLMQTGPGDLFELRNAGNMVPPYGASNGGEAASIEFALVGLGVRNIIICGHTHCGALKALLEPAKAANMPLVGSWLQHAETTRRVMLENYPGLAPEDRLNVAVQEHVLMQVENIQTHPAVAVRLQRQELAIHAWVYKLETGDMFAYSQEAGMFLPLTAEPELIPEAPSAPLLLAAARSA